MAFTKVSSAGINTGGTFILENVSTSGVITATSFVGPVTGNVTGNVTGDVTGNITGVAATFSGNVSIAGTLTYEDVTNIDSIGIVTARTGIVVSAGGITAIGIVTTTTGLDDQSGGLTLDSWLYGGG